MEIIIGKTAGFCFGVSNAVNKTLEVLKENKFYCLRREYFLFFFLNCNLGEYNEKNHFL